MFNQSLLQKQLLSTFKNPLWPKYKSSLFYDKVSRQAKKTFFKEALGGPLGLLEYLLLGHQYIYIYIWVQVLRNFPWVGVVVGVDGVYWSLGVPNGKWVFYWVRNGAHTFRNSIEDNASPFMHIGFVFCLLINFLIIFFLGLFSFFLILFYPLCY